MPVMHAQFSASTSTLRQKLQDHHQKDLSYVAPPPPEPSELELLSQKHNDPSKYSNPVLKAYVAFSKYVWELAYGEYSGYFDAFIISIIIMAGANVGIQTYPIYECPAPMAQTDEWKDSLRDNDHTDQLNFCQANGDQWLGGGGIVDTVIFWTFVTEVFIKIVANGSAPWNYWLGPEWRWNNFDFAIVLLSIDEFSALLFGGGGGGNIMILRLFRLARLLKLVGKIPKLQAIVLGLIAGMKASGYIAMLLFLVFYIFAIAGMMAFQRNDPFHFRSIPVALLSLFRATTLEDWTDIMYISVYGCDKYTSGIYYTEEARSDPSAFDGTFWRDWSNLPDYFKCLHPSAQPALSVFYWILFVFICTFVMLSLFIGAITMAMSDTAMTDTETGDDASTRARLAHETIGPNGKHRDEIFVDHAQEISELFKKVWNAYAIATNDELINFETEDEMFVLGAYSRFARLNQQLVDTPFFQNFVTATILVAGIAVGVDQEYHAEPTPIVSRNEGEEARRNIALWYLDCVINWIFTVEVAMKIVGQDWHPWRFFNDGWNKFDFFIVFTSWLPVMLGGGNKNLGALKLLRLLRLFRIMRVIKKLPELTVIVDALLVAMESIGFIALILFVTFYLFAVGGMILFASTDPWHFGRLHRALLTLFRVSTFEDWTDVMYINLYGCKRWGYNDDGSEPYPRACVKQDFEPNVYAAFYFIAFVFLASFTLLTLFVGVVTTSMEQARDRQRAIRDGENKIVAFFTACAAHDAGALTEEVMKAFRICDVTEDGNVSLTEFMSAVTVITLLDDPYHPPQYILEGERFYESEKEVNPVPMDGNPYIFLKYILNYMAKCSGSDAVILYNDEDCDDETSSVGSASRLISLAGNRKASPRPSTEEPLNVGDPEAGGTEDHHLRLIPEEHQSIAVKEENHHGGGVERSVPPPGTSPKPGGDVQSPQGSSLDGMGTGADLDEEVVDNGADLDDDGDV